MATIMHMEMDREKRLGEEKILPLIIKFSIPAITSMMVSGLYNVVDRIYVGQGVGEEGLAGIAVGLPLMTIMMAFAALIGVGATALVSISLGENKKEEAEKIAGNSIILLITTSIVITVGGLIFINPLLRLFGASDDVLPYARDYMVIILGGSIFLGIGFGMNNLIRGEGNPKKAALMMLVGALINIVLDPLFIFVFKWGIKGAAFATILSQAAIAVWALHYYLFGDSVLKIHVSGLKVSKAIAVRIATVGSAAFTRQVAMSFLGIIMNNSLARYGGDSAIAVMGILNSIIMVLLMPVFGINQGAQPIIGYNYGAMQYTRVKSALKYSIIGASIISFVGFAIVQLFAEPIVSIFVGRDDHLIGLGAHAVRIFFMMLPIVGFQIVSSNYFQSVGKPMQTIVLTLSRQVLILIPVLLILPGFLGLDGVFYSAPIADFISCVVTAVWLFVEVKSLNTKQDKAREIEVCKMSVSSRREGFVNQQEV